MPRVIAPGLYFESTLCEAAGRHAQVEDLEGLDNEIARRHCARLGVRSLASSWVMTYNFRALSLVAFSG
jgi:hypothetical protein